MLPVQGNLTATPWTDVKQDWQDGLAGLVPQSDSEVLCRLEGLESFCADTSTVIDQGPSL